MSHSDDDITIIKKDIADIKIILDKLNNHIIFIDNTYNYVKNTLNYIKEKIDLISPNKMTLLPENSFFENAQKLLNASKAINPDL